MGKRRPTRPTDLEGKSLQDASAHVAARREARLASLDANVNVVRLGKRSAKRKSTAAHAGSGSAEILLFTGVQIVRDDPLG